MAIVKFGITIVGIRGTVGGGTYSANKSGPYLKPWQYPVVPATTPELLQRARMAELPTLWRGFTQALRDNWDALAASGPYDRVNSLGISYQLSGYQLFSSWSRVRQTAIGSAYIGVPAATIPTPPPDLATSANVSLNNMLVTLAAGNYTTPFRTYIEAQPLRTTSLAALPKQWRFMRAPSLTPPTSTNILSDWQAAFGAIQVGQAYAVRLRRMNNEGTISTALEAKQTVIA